MSICHHPNDELLLDYASGSLGEAWSLAIASHLALCPQCRKTLSAMEAVGGALLEDMDPAGIGDDSFEKIMARLEGPDAVSSQLERSRGAAAGPDDRTTAGATPVLPEPLRSYLGGDVETLVWKRLGLGASQILIPTSDSIATARLLRIAAGRPVPEHSHGGRELTLVLQGAFRDEIGEFGPGDFQEADEEVLHQPHAAAGEDCICLAITDAPLNFKSLTARIAQPFLGI